MDENLKNLVGDVKRHGTTIIASEILAKVECRFRSVRERLALIPALLCVVSADQRTLADMKERLLSLCDEAALSPVVDYIKLVAEGCDVPVSEVFEATCLAFLGRPDPGGDKQTLGTDEAARELGVCEKTIRCYLVDGRLKGFKTHPSAHGGRWKIPLSEIRRFQSERRAG